MPLASPFSFSAAINARFPPVGEMVSVGGRTLHYATAGPAEAPVLILLHGASGNLLDWTTSVTDALAAEWRVIAFDRPGYGHSDPAPRQSWLIHPQVEMLRAAVRELGHTRYALLGHSYGVAVALDWALAFPDDVCGLLAMSGAMESWEGALGWRYRWGGLPLAGQAMGAMVPLVATERLLRSELAEVFAPQPVPDHYLDTAGVALALRPATFALNLRSMDTLHAQTMAFLPRARDVLCPCEVLHGAADEIVPYDPQSRPVAAGVPGAEVTLLPDIGHMPHHVDQPSVLAAAARLKTRITER